MVTRLGLSQYPVYPILIFRVYTLKNNGLSSEGRRAFVTKRRFAGGRCVLDGSKIF